MKNLFTKWLAALLAALLLLSPVALMEEVEPAAEAPAEVVEAVEPAEPAAEDAGEEAEPAADDELILDAEEEVAEETDVEFVEENADTDDDFGEEEEVVYEAEDVDFVASDAMDSVVSEEGRINIEQSFDQLLWNQLKSIDTDTNGLDSNEIQNVITIDLSNQSEATLGTLRNIDVFQNLQTLNLSGTGITNYNSSSNPLTRFPSLKTLDLSNCPNLTEVNLYDYNKNNLPSLNSLKLNSCPVLTRVSISNINVTELDFTGCPYMIDLVQSTFLESYEWEGVKYNSCYNMGSGLNFTGDVKIIPEPRKEIDKVQINATNFADGKFREIIAGNRYDKNSNGWLSDKELENCWTMYVGTWEGSGDNETFKGAGAASLNGIENFAELDFLNCSNNQLTSLDLSKNTKIGELMCSNNKLTSLIIGNNKSLYQLYCENNQITTLDISQCSEYFLAHINPKHYRLVDDNKHVEYFETHSCTYKGVTNSWDEVFLRCDSNVQIIGGNPVAPYSEPAPAPATAPAPAPAPVINALKKNGKATVTAAPGTVCQLNLGGKTGKKFKSSKKKVATVDKNGNVTIKGAGKTTITVKVGKKTRKVKLTVKDPTIPTSVALNPVDIAVKKGDTVTLTPVIPDGTSSAFKWKSSNKKVATVKNGVVTFKKKGKVTITCTAKRGKKKAKITFNVSPQ